MTKPLRTLLLAATAISAVHAPIAASTVIFASGGFSRGSLPAGEQRVDGGVVQLRLTDGTMVSIVGPATFQVGGNGQLTVSRGSFTAMPRKPAGKQSSQGMASPSRWGRAGRQRPDRRGRQCPRLHRRGQCHDRERRRQPDLRRR
jgi:hypothetical protein